MGNVGKAIAGVAASAGILLGAYGLDELESKQDRSRAADCVEIFEGQALEDCVRNVRDNDGYIPEILGITGLIGVVGCGYLGYKALKSEIGTTGIVDDHL